MSIKLHDKRRCIAVLLFLAFISLGFFSLPKSRVYAVDDSEKPQTEAVSAILFDARRGQILFSKTSDEVSHTPLANRIVAALLTLEKADPEALVTVSKDVVNTKGATLALTVGEKYAVKNLLYAMLLTGSPDAAKALAESIGGSEQGFVEMMNEYALSHGMTNTHFTDSIGLYDENQYTTPEDIRIIIKEALADSRFNRFFSTQAIPLYFESKTTLLYSTNNMFWSYPGTDGGITASNDSEFHSIITTATKNNIRLVCVLLDVPTKSMYNDSIDLLNYGFDNFLEGTLVTAGSSQQAITVEGQTLNLIVTSDVYYVHPKGEDYIKDVAINVDQTALKPPITTKTIVGTLTFILEDDTKINVNLYPDREILPQKTRREILIDRLMESRELIYVIIGLVILEIIIGAIKLYDFLKKRMARSKSRRNRRRSPIKGRK
ncbi:MAG: D-alanyl-D-alanine carboxypeptidase [Clostridiaceae bacterium]|jgi:D-alanyl-D-alanine carboxypeptidase (penicillin-binding protein 5/6)|nr:D-alanyl-D-alanine carboxypeptidase [Clostridiaceae bacterium]